MAVGGFAPVKKCGFLRWNMLFQTFSNALTHQFFRGRLPLFRQIQIYLRVVNIYPAPHWSSSRHRLTSGRA